MASNRTHKAVSTFWGDDFGPLPADVGPFDNSRPGSAGASSLPDASLSGPATQIPSDASSRVSTTVHRLDTTVSALPLQSRSQLYFHRGVEDVRQHVYVALANSESGVLRRRAERIAACCLSPSFHLRADSTVSVSVIRCRDRLCPTCARARSRQTRERARRAVQRMDALRFLTLTMPHSDRPLADQLRTIRDAFSRLRKSDVWKRCVTGGVVTVEVTRNTRDKQWHPHLHALLDGDFVPHAEIRDAWRRALNASVGREWIKPEGHVIVHIEMIGGRSAAVAYITKYATKPADVAKWSQAEIAEAASALAGVRVLSTIGHLHGRTLDPRDPNEDEPESVLICNIYAVQMRRQLGCPMAEAFVILLIHACPIAGEFFTSVPARAGPIPQAVIDQAGDWLYLLGRAFVATAPTVPIKAPWL